MSAVDLINEETKLIRHRLMARRLPSDPGMIERANDRLRSMSDKYGDASFVKDWERILSLPQEEIRQRMVARDQESYRLRISSPFSTISGIQFGDEAMRRRIWKIAKRLVDLRLSKPDGWNKWLDLHKFERRMISIASDER
jgi:hypothetical protein